MKWELLNVSQLTQYQSEWDRLNAKGPNSVLLESRFIFTAARHFGSSQDILAVATDGDVTIALAILARGKLGSWSTLQPSQSPLGIWIHDQQYSLEELLATLAKRLPGLTTNIGITQQDPVLLARMNSSRHISTMDYIETASISINNDSFDDYWSRRGRNLRQNMKRQRNRLNRENVALELRILSSPDDMLKGIEMYGDLESAGWKAESGTAISTDNQQGKFYCELLSGYASTNNAKIYQFFYDEKLVSVDLCISDEKQIVILKTTYDESQKTSSPALLMRREYFESLFNTREFERIEFYGKVMDWHTKWADDIRTLFHINYYPSQLLKKIRDK